ncbi:membrane protein [Streptomyces sp. 150FB]|jgi:uncharacterized membrane protein YedE/YeeE|uniref:hypothetical protein n=1 Tax=Streptomyces sp. 150FB TaxID=1576605 RepID=UPI0005890570|nr:hypothetical protein [Streptomyces sp. 150FB]KIF78999.1 membrane protein [Streptomyces sp. 150FB]
MGIGGCIALIGVGAILTFATDWHSDSVNIDLVGLIMMAVGIIGIATFTSIARRRRGLGATTVVEQRDDRNIGL